jgi:hypothetical protein
MKKAILYQYRSTTQVLADGESTYLYGLGRIGEEGVAGCQYHHGDALGSVRQLTDPGGAISLAKSYEPYGDLLSSAEKSCENNHLTYR